MEEQQPSDRGRNGRFVPGNKAAKGNPHARKLRLYRNMLCECIDDEERFRRMVRGLIDRALEGDLQAIKLVLDYTLGKPKREVAFESPTATKAVPAEDLERLTRTLEEYPEQS